MDPGNPLREKRAEILIPHQVINTCFQGVEVKKSRQEAMGNRR